MAVRGYTAPKLRAAPNLGPYGLRHLARAAFAWGGPAQKLRGISLRSREPQSPLPLGKGPGDRLKIICSVRHDL